MRDATSLPTVTSAGTPVFPTTHWSMIVAAGDNQGPAARMALEELCRAYWFPLYAFLRRRGYDAHTAEDSTQEFFAQLLAAGRIRMADQKRGKFRSFLLGSMRNFLSHQRERSTALKRGGKVPVLEFDAAKADERFKMEAVSADLTPEEAFDRQWALQVIERALAALEKEYADAGRGTTFRELRHEVWGSGGNSIEALAEKLKMSPGAVKVTIHRLRRRLREQLRSEVGQTVETSSDTEEELHILLAALKPPRTR